MTLEACEKFVGPMPVNDFLSEFVPDAAKDAAGKRPANEISFAFASVSQNEKSFVSYRIPRGVNTQKYYRSTQWNPLVSAPNSHLEIPLLV